MTFTPHKLTAEALMWIHADAVHSEGNTSGGQLVLSLSFASPPVSQVLCWYSVLALSVCAECAQFHITEPRGDLESRLLQLPSRLCFLRCCLRACSDENSSAADLWTLEQERLWTSSKSQCQGGLCSYLFTCIQQWNTTSAAGVCSPQIR